MATVPATEPPIAGLFVVNEDFGGEHSLNPVNRDKYASEYFPK